MTKLDNAIKEKRPALANRKGIVFHHDNARPHTYLATRQKLMQLSWDVLPHPPYSPDIEPSDYYLFQNLQNFLQGKNLNNDYEVRLQLMLSEKWQKVIDNSGH